VRVLPEPLRATAEQPAIELVPSVKFTLPVGLNPVTDAVKVTLAPSAAGLAELDSVELLAALFTTCDSALLVEGLFDALPA
jgi:hypothetical protein